MKKILLTAGTVLFFSGFAFAQKQAKTVEKKRLTVTLIEPAAAKVETKAQMDAQIKAKQKHYQEMQAARKASNETAATTDPKLGARKKSN